MTITFPPAMAEALRMTRRGDLREATALLRATLGGPPPATAAPRQASPPIDLTPVRSGPAKVTVARASRFEARHRGVGAEQIAYHLYVPADAAAGMPLVVMLHGCTQSAEDFARGTGMNALADELGFLVAYPSQTTRANAQKCWNWFQPGHQRRDGGEPALIAGLTRQVIADESVDPTRVFVAGMSAGGAAAAIMAAAYPDLYAAVGIHSGLACGSARDLPSALTAMRNGGGAGTGCAFVPVITFHGDRDTTVSAVNAREIVAAATVSAGPLRTHTETGRSEGGRAYTRETGADDNGRILIEQWTIHGAGHAWSGGDRSGSYTDPAGPDASRAMLDFFLKQHRERGDAA